MTLSDWDLHGVDNVPTWKKPSWSRSTIPPIAVVQFCREIDALWTLPAAFYEWGAHSAFDVALVIRGAAYGTSFVQLNKGDQVSFLKGYALLRGSTLAAAGFLYSPVTAGCSTPRQCSDNKLAALDMVKTGDYLCLAPLDVWDQDDWDLIGMCATCRPVLRQLHMEYRANFWDNLPGMFGFPPWAVLEGLKAAAIGLS